MEEATTAVNQTIREEDAQDAFPAENLNDLNLECGRCGYPYPTQILRGEDERISSLLCQLCGDTYDQSFALCQVFNSSIRAFAIQKGIDVEVVANLARASIAEYAFKEGFTDVFKDNEGIGRPRPRPVVPNRRSNRRG